MIDAFAGSGKVIFVDAGSYLLLDTITVPSGTIIVGECWPSLMATGINYQNAKSPHVLFRVGKKGGEVGHVQIQDLLFTTIGATSGLVAVEWNIAVGVPTTGSAAMWGK